MRHKASLFQADGAGPVVEACRVFYDDHHNLLAIFNAQRRLLRVLW